MSDTESNLEIWAVIGGRGKIGRDLIRRLLAMGKSVRVVGHAQRTQLFMGCEYRCANVCDRERLGEALRGVQVVVQSTTATSSSPSGLERDILLGTRVVVETCQLLNIRRLIYLSTISALDLSKKRFITCSEGLDQKPYERNYYARFKNLAEQVVTSSFQPGKFEPIVLRPGIVLGPGISIQHDGFGQWVTPTACKTFGPGTNALPFVLCEDVSDAIVKAGLAKSLPCGAYNLVGDVRFSAVQFMALAERYSLRRFRVRSHSYRYLWLEAWLKWLAKTVFRPSAGRRPCLRDIRSMGCESQFDCSWAKEHLDWRPNSEFEYFCHQVFGANLKPPPPGDLRL